MALIDILESKILDLPYQRLENEVMQTVLEKKFKDYIMLLQNNEMVSKTVVLKAENISRHIGEALKAYYNGHFNKAYQQICVLMHEVNEEFELISRFYSKKLPRVYYRMRKSHQALMHKTDLFHVPFEKRYVIENTRYSIAGYPCLYLGATPYTCWEECNRSRQDEKLYFARYERPLEYHYIELALLPYELKERYMKGEIKDELILMSYMSILPIIMACSMAVPESMKIAPFKDEYIIPQLIAQWLISEENIYDGISYFSVMTKDYSKQNYRLYQNLAIPVKTAAQTGYCKELMKHLKFTQPILQEINSSTRLVPDYIGNAPNPVISNGLITINKTEKINYTQSVFALIEQLLSDKKCTTLI